MTEAMAVTHAITWLKEEKLDKTEMMLVGDPLDVEMFQCTEWILDEENTTEFIAQRMYPKDASSEYRLSLLRRFDFTSQLMRASSIVMYDIDNTYRGFVKGAPEKLKELCKEHTIPANFDAVNEFYTKNGYRVIALGTKVLEGMTEAAAHKCERETVESDLEFIGFLVMENKLKPETSAVIKTLQQAEIRTVMATGDNILTAMSVAAQCNVIS